MFMKTPIKRQKGKQTRKKKAGRHSRRAGRHTKTTPCYFALDEILLGLYKQIFCLLQTYWKNQILQTQTLLNVLCENFETMKLDLKQISGLCTDGASVMFGKRDGLGAKL